jgi:hypothetical protein
MLKPIPFLLVLATAAFAQDSAKEEAQVWNLEKAYWEYATPTTSPDRFLPSETLFLPG